jgi:hypothetical protein
VQIIYSIFSTQGSTQSTDISSKLKGKKIKENSLKVPTNHSAPKIALMQRQGVPAPLPACPHDAGARSFHAPLQDSYGGGDWRLQQTRM